jgi:hypothetical protein
MPGNVVAKVRTFLLRGLAVAAVVLTYTLSSVGIQVASIVGVSSVVLATSATPAQAQYRRFRRRRRVIFVRRRRPRRRVFFRRRRRFY